MDGRMDRRTFIHTIRCIRYTTGARGIRRVGWGENLFLCCHPSMSVWVCSVGPTEKQAGKGRECAILQQDQWTIQPTHSPHQTTRRTTDTHEHTPTQARQLYIPATLANRQTREKGRTLTHSTPPHPAPPHPTPRHATPPRTHRQTDVPLDPSSRGVHGTA